MVQHDLNGNEITFEKIVTKRTLYFGGHFCLSVTETGEAELERLREGDIDISDWIAKHMRAKNPMPTGKWGECYQKDMIRLKERLEKGTIPD